MVKNPEEYEQLSHIHTAGLMRKIMPEEVEKSLMEQGYINRRIGGHVLTEKAWKVLYPEKK